MGMLKTSLAIVKPILSINKPNIQKGNSFPMMNWYFFIGVTLICSKVPISFSRTIFIEDKNKVNIVTRRTKIPGTIKVL